MLKKITAENEKIKVLVVDNEALIAYAMKIALEALGFEVDLARNGKEAATLCDDQKDSSPFKYKAVFTDLNMPQMKGDALAAYLRQQDFFKDAKIFVLSGDVSSLKELKESNLFDRILVKPVLLSDLEELCSLLAVG
jgi:CheY-like chemotaxis protein